MTSNLDSREPSATDRATKRAYKREFVPGIVAYILILSAALIWGDLDGNSPARFVWAIVPVLPMVWVAIAVLRHIRRVDEYQRFLLLQGLGVGFALAMVASLTVGLLDVAGLSIPGSAWIVYAVGMLGWLVTAQVSARR